MRFLILAVLAVVLIGCGEEKNEDTLVFCAQDTRQCEDGSFVSRLAPSCEFAACPKDALIPLPMTSDTISLSSIPAAAESSEPQRNAPTIGSTVARIATTKGDIWLTLFPDAAPRTVENFIGLAKRGYYNGIIFHRVIEHFMVQTGDPTGTGTGGESFFGEDFEDEFSEKLSHLVGAVSMANRGPSTNGSQFFIVHAKDGTPHLNGRHSVFGQVFAGLSVVDAIATTETGAMDKPLKSISMQGVDVFQVVE